MDNRRENLRRIVESRGGTKHVAINLLGYRTASYLSQMIGPSHSRPITEDTARAIETKLSLEEGSLDWPPLNGQLPAAVIKSAAAPAPQGDAPVDAKAAARDAQIVQMLATVWSEDKVALPVLKFGQIAAYAISEAAETGHVPSPEMLRRLVKLLT
jgi:hypothetical protein